jgi:hypothetical protein
MAAESSGGVLQVGALAFGKKSQPPPGEALSGRKGVQRVAGGPFGQQKTQPVVDADLLFDNKVEFLIHEFRGPGDDDEGRVAVAERIMQSACPQRDGAPIPSPIRN